MMFLLVLGFIECLCELFGLLSNYHNNIEGQGWSGLMGNVLQTDLLKAVGGVTKSNGSVVEGTWLQLMCCTLPKCLCPSFISGLRMEVSCRLSGFGWGCHTRDG